MLIQWDDSLAVGNHEIDSDHKHLVYVINRLYDAIRDNCADEIIDSVLSDLADYTDYHFRREEQAMIAHRYEEYERHRRYHNELIEQLSDLIHRFEKDRNSVTTETLEFLRHWFIDHVRVTDVRLAAFLRSREVTI